MAQTAPEVESKDGMKFEHGSWTEILAKAKKENKYIIVDCFTTWCGPCKYMDSKIFPTKEAGDFFNANYLNVKIQFDSTANDNAEVKSWRKDMKAIEKEYAINAYLPTSFSTRTVLRCIERWVLPRMRKNLLPVEKKGWRLKRSITHNCADTRAVKKIPDFCTKWP